jgi:hypothetical protein
MTCSDAKSQTDLPEGKTGKNLSHRKKIRECNQTLAKNFNRTLRKIFSSPPQPLHEIRELINQTLRKFFSSGSAEKIYGPGIFSTIDPHCEFF